MGRPLSKRVFGADGGNDGFQITGTAWFPGELAAEPAFIVRQRSTYRFLVEGVTSGKQMIAALGDGAPSGEGEFRVPVNSTESAKKITANKVTTHEGNVFAWSEITAADDSVDDAITADLGTDDDNLS